MFRFIVLPQALRNMLPALIAQLVALFKTTSLVYAIGVMDFFRAVNVTKNAVFAPYALYLILGAGYFVSCFAITTRGALVRSTIPVAANDRVPPRP